MLKGISPPVVHALFRQLSDKDNGFSGNYRTWDEACRASGGYDSEVILNRVKDALLKVKKGAAVYERDSVLFEKIEYSWPLLAGLLWIASQNGNNLNIADFGGSLGSSYFQNRHFLAHLPELQWNIIEQKKFVECGKRCFEDAHLKFYYSLDDCLKEQQPGAILLSSVLQYLEKPYTLLQEVINKRFKYLVIDRTAFIEAEGDRITVQKVPENIYHASYPAWFFNEHKFLRFLSGSYTLMADFESNDRVNIPSVFKGFIFKLTT